MMKKVAKKLVILLCMIMLMTALAACGDKKDGDSASDGGSASADAVTGTWKQTDEVNGNWTWTFDGGKATLVGETTGFKGEGTYTLDEANKKLKVKIDAWDNEKEYDYVLDGNKLSLKEKYSSYELVKQ